MTLSDDEFFNRVKQLDQQRIQQQVNIPQPISRKQQTLSSKDQGFLSSDDEDYDYHSDLKYKSAYNYEKSLKNINGNEGRSISASKAELHVKEVRPQLPKRSPIVQEPASSSEDEDIDQLRQTMGGSYIHHEKVSMPDIIRFDDYKSNFNQKYLQRTGGQQVQQFKELDDDASDKNSDYVTAREYDTDKNGFILTEEQRDKLDNTINQLIYKQEPPSSSSFVERERPKTPPKPRNFPSSLKNSNKTSQSESEKNEESKPKLPNRPVSSSSSSSNHPSIPKSPKKLNLTTYTQTSKQNLFSKDIPKLKLSPPKPPVKPKSTYINSIHSRSVSTKQALSTESNFNHQSNSNGDAGNAWLGSMMAHSEFQTQGLKTGINEKIKIQRHTKANINSDDEEEKDQEKNGKDEFLKRKNVLQPPLIPKKSSVVLRKVSENSEQLINVKSQLKSGTTKTIQEKEQINTTSPKPILKPKPNSDLLDGKLLSKNPNPPIHLKPVPTTKHSVSRAENIQLPKLRPTKPSTKPTPAQLEALAKQSELVSSNSGISKLKELERTKRIVSGNKELLNKSLRGLRSVNNAINTAVEDHEGEEAEHDILQKSLRGLKSVKTSGSGGVGSNETVKKFGKEEEKELLKSSLSGLRSRNSSKPEIKNKPENIMNSTSKDSTNESENTQNLKESGKQENPEITSKSQTKSILEGLMLRKIHTDPSLPSKSSISASETTSSESGSVSILKKAHTFDVSTNSKNNEEEELKHLTKARAKGPTRRAPKNQID